MKKMISKTVKMLPIAMLIALLIYVNGTVASANNHTDTSFEFYFNAAHQQGYASSSGREKQDYSSSYMYCNYAYETNVNGTFKYDATVHGSVTSNGTYTDRYYGSKHSKTYTFTNGDWRYMSNYVKESGASWAKIFVKKNGPAATFRGLWSTDSI